MHWKLSFRLGDIYVREYGEPVTDSLCIYVETGGNVPAADYDRIASKALSLSMYLSDGGIGHYMAFYSFSQQISTAQTASLSLWTAFFLHSLSREKSD